MKRFEGFPDGEMQFTAVPDLFFSRLLVDVDNLAELKVTLHFIWMRQRHSLQLISKAELLADETLMKGLAVVTDRTPEVALDDGLSRAVARGTLLHSWVDDENGRHELYSLNSEGGRRAIKLLREGQVGVLEVRVMEKAQVDSRPNIFELYEKNIGLLTPIITDELKDAEATYPPDWIEEAFRIAVRNNARKWSYVLAILESWATRGKDEATRKDADEQKKWFTDEEFEKYFLH